MKKLFVLTPAVLASALISGRPAHGQDALEQSIQELQNSMSTQLAPTLLENAQELAKAGDAMLAQLSQELNGVGALSTFGTLGSGLGAWTSREMGSSRTVTGAPYCADAIHETVQTLADGNRIVRKNTTRWCRDGQGRSRQETQRNGRTVVYLRDPVAKQSWTMDPQAKTATPLRMAGQPADSAGMREFSEHMRAWAHGFSQRMREHTLAMSTKSGAEKTSIDPAVITQAPSADRTGNDVYVIRMQADEAPSPATLPTPPTPPTPPHPPAWQGSLSEWMPSSLRMHTPRGQGVQTSLGSKEFEGVKANGERTTWMIEAGKYGNEKPIIITSEKWTAPDLMLTVYARDVDPRSGETVYKLTNLKRSEPNAALFKVPSDFKVREAKGYGWRMPRPKHEMPTDLQETKG